MVVILDYNPARQLYILRVKRGEEPTPDVLIREFGLDYSETASKLNEAVLYTSSPYAAATFAHVATPAAREAIGWILREIEASRASSGNGHYDVPRAKIDQGDDLWDFQKADLDYMLNRERVMDADEPGLGKTPTAIVYANMVQAQRVLVLSPANIRYQWIRQIAGDGVNPGWSTMGETYKTKSMGVYAVLTSKLGVHPDAAWTVCSYDLARNAGILPALRAIDFDLLILDEAHYLKEIGAKRSRAVWGGGSDPLYVEALADKAKYVVELTGTPLPNRPREAYNHARHLDHSSIDRLSEERFTERYNPIEYREIEKREPIEMPGGTVEYRTVIKKVPDERSGRHAELQNRMRAHFMTRHLKREVMKDLKYPVYDLVQVNETAQIRAALHAESLLGIDPETLAGADVSALGHIAEARRIMGEAMAPQVADYVNMLIAGGEEKITVFYHHRSVGSILQQRLLKHDAVRVDGSTSPVVKDALVQKFINDPDCKVILGHMLTLGTGTDGLQHVCWHAVIAEPDWTPGVNVQAFDRLDRGGQRMLVQGDICVAPGSLAEKVLASALRKLRVTHNSLDRRVA